MLIFKFSGNLRRHFRQIALNVDTPSQGLRLLLAQCPAFKRDFYKCKLRVRVEGHDLTTENKNFHMDRPLSDGASVIFVPVVEGSGLELSTIAIIAAVTLSVASVAYSLYATSNMKKKTSAESAQSNSITNNSYTSIENRIGQGRPVPILLGEMMVGSNVGSLGIDTTNNKDWNISIS